MPNVKDAQGMLNAVCSIAEGNAKKVVDYIRGLYSSWEISSASESSTEEEIERLREKGIRKALRNSLRKANDRVDLKTATEEEKKACKIFNKISGSFKGYGTFFTGNKIDAWLKYANEMINADKSQSVFAMIPGVNTSNFAVAVNEIKKESQELENKLDDIRSRIRQAVRGSDESKESIINEYLMEAKSFINTFYSHATEKMNGYVVHISRSLSKVKDLNPDFFNIYKILKYYFFLKSMGSVREGRVVTVREADKIHSGVEPGWFEKWLCYEYECLKKEKGKTEKRIADVAREEAAAAAAAAAEAAGE